MPAIDARAVMSRAAIGEVASSSVPLRRPATCTASDSVADLRRENTQLRCKLANQPDIEQAKGMLMSSFGLSSDQAFDLLRSVSQADNVKLRVVAHHIVSSWTSGGPRPDYEEAAEFLVTVRRRVSST
jgi:diaminopimelate decarboxylase